MLVSAVGVEEQHSSVVLLFLLPAQDVWKLHPELFGFLFFYFCVFRLPPLTAQSFIWVQMPASGPAFFFFSSLFYFPMEMTATQNAGLRIAVRGLPKGRGISGQNQTALANLDLTLCGRGSLHLMSHEATKSTLPLLCHSQKGQVCFITVS